MTEEESLEMIRTRWSQLKAEVDERSKHKNPMYYKALENYRWCSMVMSLMEGDWPMDNEVEAVCGVKQPRQQSVSGLVLDVKEGDNVMDILDKYRDTVPDIHDRLKEAVKQAGLVVEGFYIRAPK